MRKTVRTFAFLFLVLLLPAISFADERPARAPGPHAAAPPGTEWRHPFELRSGLEAFAARSGESSITRIDYVTGISFYFSSWLETYMNFRVGYMSFGHRGEVDDSTGIRAELSKAGQFSINDGFRLALIDRGRVRWTVFGEYETALNGQDPRTESVVADRAGTEFDLTSYMRDHGSFSYEWHRFAAGTGILVRLGRVSPTFAVGVERFEAHASLRLDEEARDALRALGYDPRTVERRWPLGHTTVLFMPGMEIELAERTRLSIECIVVPIPEGWALGASAGIVYRP